MGVGAVSAEVDQPTGVLRRMPLMVGINGQPYPSLGLDAVRVFLGEPSYTVKYNELGVEWIRLGRQSPLITQPTSELPITFWNKFKSQSILDPIPEGKVVILGVTAEGVSNPVPTPSGSNVSPRSSRSANSDLDLRRSNTSTRLDCSSRACDDSDSESKYPCSGLQTSHNFCGDSFAWRSTLFAVIWFLRLAGVLLFLRRGLGIACGSPSIWTKFVQSVLYYIQAERAN